MKKESFRNLIIVLTVLLSFSCSKEQNSDPTIQKCTLTDSIENVTIKFIPDEGTSSVEYFEATFNKDKTVSGSLNNEAQYYGVIWEFVECPAILLTYPDGGKENITFKSETRYDYTGMTSSGYVESHSGTWNRVTLTDEDSGDDLDEEEETNDETGIDLDYNPLRTSMGGVEILNGKNFFVINDDNSTLVFDDLAPQTTYFHHNKNLYASSQMAYTGGQYYFFPKIVYDFGRIAHYLEGSEIIKVIHDGPTSGIILVTTSGTYFFGDFSAPMKILDRSDVLYTTLYDRPEDIEISEYNTVLLLTEQELIFYGSRTESIQFSSKVSSYKYFHEYMAVTLENDTKTYYYSPVGAEYDKIHDAPEGYSNPVPLGKSSIFYKKNVNDLGGAVVVYSNNEILQIIDVDLENIKFVQGNINCFYLGTDQEVYLMDVNRLQNSDYELHQKKVLSGTYTSIYQDKTWGDAIILSEPNGKLHILIADFNNQFYASNAIIDHVEYVFE